MSCIRSVLRSFVSHAAVLVGLAALSLTLAVPTSNAAVNHERDTIVTTPIIEEGLPDDCRPGLVGTLVGTDTFTYHSVETAQGFHIAGTDVGTGRITWSDGTYTVIESTDHFAFNTGRGAEVYTDAHVDYGYTYSADGVFLFRGTYHAIEHFTTVNGVVQVEFERHHLRVVGIDC